MSIEIMIPTSTSTFEVLGPTKVKVEPSNSFVLVINNLNGNALLDINFIDKSTNPFKYGSIGSPHLVSM